MPQFIEYDTNYKNITVKITDGSTITGKINVLNFMRLSDLLKQSTDKFITVFDDNNQPDTKRATIINKEHIIWAETWD
jgi:hypothetical protein